MRRTLWSLCVVESSRCTEHYLWSHGKYFTRFCQITWPLNETVPTTWSNLVIFIKKILGGGSDISYCETRKCQVNSQKTVNGLDSTHSPRRNDFWIIFKGFWIFFNFFSEWRCRVKRQQNIFSGFKKFVIFYSTRALQRTSNEGHKMCREKRTQWNLRWVQLSLPSKN